MLNRLSQTKNLELMQAHVNGLLYDQNTVYGVKTEDGRHIEGKTVILTTGTFLEGRIYISSWSKPAGRWGEFPATGISEDLKKLGFSMGRFNTGTTPRIDEKTIDYSKLPYRRTIQVYHSHSGKNQIPLVTNPCTW